MSKRRQATIRIPREWSEFVSALRSAKVKFMVVGSHALAAHGRPRYSGEIDIFIAQNPQNVAKVCKALTAFGFGEYADPAWLSVPGNGLHLGVVPMRIDVLTGISGVSFDEAWKTRTRAILNEHPVNIIGRNAYIKNKKAAGRPKDLTDIALLEEVSVPKRRRGTRRILAEYESGSFMQGSKKRLRRRR